MYFIPLELQGAYPRYGIHTSDFIPLELQEAYPRYGIHTSVFAVRDCTYGNIFEVNLIRVFEHCMYNKGYLVIVMIN